MHKFEESYQQLNSQQREAVDQIQGPLLVIAGPGTGKTQLLSVRSANILQKTDTDPENILCLTFTESGTNAMRKRLNSLIGSASNKINISTYHAFGSDIIYHYRNFTNSVHNRLDTPLDPVRQHKLISELQSKLAHNDILRSAKVSDLIATIAEVKSARLSSSDLATIAAENLKDSAKINTTSAPILGQIPKGARFKVSAPFYEQLRSQIAPYISKKPITGKVERIANSLLDSLNDVLSREQNAKKPSTAPLTKWRDLYYEKDEQNNFVLKNTIANKKLASLANFLDLYNTALAKDALFDFADMIEEAIQYLKNDAAFRYSVQEKYQYILLDEFQDTNDSQFELIRLIADYENPNIMAVGDDDQAIFAFQGARYSNLMDFQTAFNAKIVVLTTNYRSDQGIINFAASTAKQISERFSSKYDIVKKLNAHSNTEAEISRRDFLASTSEYSYVASQVAQLIRSGQDPREIAIIAPKHKQLEAILPYFAAYPEVKLSYEKRENILEATEVAPLIKIAQLTHNLASIQPSAQDLLEILSFPFWGIPALDVVSLMSEAQAKHLFALDYIKDSPNPKLAQIAKFLADLALHSFTAPLEIMLDYILGSSPLNDFTSPYLDYYTKDNDYSALTFYENLAVLRERLQDYAKKEQLRLRDFVDFVADHQSAEQKIINTSPYQAAKRAIQLLSAHSSKGLEFEHVFLISLDNNSWGTGKGNNNQLTLPKNLEFVRHTGASEDEKLRLLFVAATRAKHKLYLTSSSQDFAGKTLQPLKFLQEANDTSPFLPEKFQKIIKVEEAEAKLPALRAHWIGRYSIENPDIKSILTKNLENYRLSASDLTTFVGLIYAGPDEFYKRRVLKSPSPYSKDASYGNFIHATLDHLTKNKTSQQATLDFFKETVLAADLEPEERDYQLEKGLDSLAIYLEARGDFLRQDQHFSELSFGREYLSLQLDGLTIPITGKLDHIVVNEEPKSIFLIDFKTGKYHSENWNSHPSLYLYKLQLQFYKLLLESSNAYSKYSVPSAGIDFVTPDEHGKVRQKVLNFNTKDMNDFKQLVKAVYQHIKDLDFPDTSGYEKTLGGIKNFIADLTSTAN